MKIWKNSEILAKVSGFCYTSPPRGNQIGDLSRALSMGLGELGSVGVWRLCVIFGYFFSRVKFGGVRTVRNQRSF